jgi:alkylated DNA repair dioxygenase AlkB
VSPPGAGPIENRPRWAATAATCNRAWRRERSARRPGGRAPVASGTQLGETKIGAARNLLPCDGEAFYHPRFFPPAEASELFAELLASLAWRQEEAVLFGRRVPLPRLTAWYGPCPYAYSGVLHAARPLAPTLRRIATALAPLAPGVDSVLANRYRTGRDSVSWHSDGEALWGDLPTIASVSFGAERRFSLRHNASRARVDVLLEHGSVLLMAGACQQAWKHCVPKASAVTERVNLTFRTLAG